MNKFSENLHKAMDQMGVPKRGRQAFLYKKLKEKVNLSQSGVRKWLVGESEPDNREKLLAVANLLKTTPEELLFGFQSESSNVRREITKVINVPVLSYVQAGQFTTNHIDYSDVKYMPMPAENLNGEHRYFFLVIEGESMINPYETQKSLNPGDMVLVDADRPANFGNIVVARNIESVDGTETTVKKLSGDKYNPKLIPTNPIFERDASYELRNGQYEIIGVMIGRYSSFV